MMASILDCTVREGLLAELAVTVSVVAMSVGRSGRVLGDYKIKQVDSYARTRRCSPAIWPRRTRPASVLSRKLVE